MSIEQFQKNVENLYSTMPIATSLFERDEDGVWRLLWQNQAAITIWDDFDIAVNPMFKLELMDALSKVAPSSFSYQIPDAIENYRFIATPNNDTLLVQFVPDIQAEVKDTAIDNQANVYPLIIESAGFGVYDWDIQADFIRFNQNSYKVFGVNALTLGTSYDKLIARIHPKDSEQVIDAIEGHLESRWPLDIEFRVLNDNQQYQWISMFGQAEWQDDKAIRLSGTLTDISSRKHTQLQLKQREILIEQLIDALPICIYVKDAVGTYRFFNKEAEKLTGKLRNQVIGRTDFEIYPISFALEQANEDKLIQSSEKIVLLEKEQAFEKQTLWMFQGKVPMHVKQLNESFEAWLLSFALDISKRKEMEEELKTARAIAEDAVKAKADFLSVMSHEIRTPLNSVIGNSGLLLSEDLDEHLAEHIEMIKRSGEHLLYLINDILDFNKLEAGKVELEKKPFDLEQQIKTVVEMSATNAKLKHIELSYSLDSELGKYYLGDEGRLRQVLLNLVGNAIKFTSQGGVSVKALLKTAELVRFEVIDTGIGIAAENISKLFFEFSQADASTTRKFGGTGLGLSISKKLVEAMGGEVGIESVEGEGSTFWFEIPFTESKAIESQSEKLENELEVKELSILVAEDNLPNQFLIKTILTKLGHTVEIANNGLEAYELIQNQDFVFDLVLMDMQMPEMNGLESTQQIRMLDSSVCNTPIIALTANTHEEDYEAVMAAGMNDYLSKPINMVALKTALQKWGKSHKIED
ncbi:MAG: ATP-binding protein [Pseudomonadota bacterium]|nr:ATP-binding protein [Pseudomonadota bacterium]